MLWALLESPVDQDLMAFGEKRGFQVKRVILDMEFPDKDIKVLLVYRGIPEIQEFLVAMDLMEYPVFQALEGTTVPGVHQGETVLWVIREMMADQV
ncbi:unnamed protein product [Oppiella nova]|uniref:Uncharacterized protein n=1 Tax=Oppiella nova TaxID=334625 RepID=A0A7R9LJD6_9ACAR|nr:unnamed protein product [Oppiella nova]CAG2164169.1 unnamed protein product [Oppiella nova]